jgi:hypothetical protein
MGEGRSTTSIWGFRHTSTHWFFTNTIYKQHMDADDETPPAATVPPPKRPRRQLHKRVGEPVEVRLAPGVWISIPKPRARRGKNHIDHLRAVLADFEAKGIPATMGNLRRVAAGRGPRLRAALAALLVEKSPVGGCPPPPHGL